LADSFSTGTTAVTLTDVPLSLDASNPAASGTFAIELLPDAGITPNFGASLAGIAGVADTSLTASPADYDYVLSTAVSLAANTRYWIAFVLTSGTSAQWSSDAGNSGTGTASEHYYSQTPTDPSDAGQRNFQLRHS